MPKRTMLEQYLDLTFGTNSRPRPWARHGIQALVPDVELPTSLCLLLGYDVYILGRIRNRACAEQRSEQLLNSPRTRDLLYV